MDDILKDPKLYSKVLTKQTGKHSVTPQTDSVLIELCLSKLQLT